MIKRPIIILIATIVFITNCNTFTAVKIQDGMEFTYERNSNRVQRRIHNLMVKRCGEDGYTILRTKDKEEEHTYAIPYVEYNTTKVDGTIQGRGYNNSYSYSGTATTSKPAVARGTYYTSYYVTIATCGTALFKYDPKSALNKIEYDFLKKSYAKCISKSEKLEERRIGCIEAILVIEDNYKKKNIKPTEDELLVLGRLSYAYCAVEPSMCHTVKKYMDLIEFEDD